jgi:uncharacterized protein (DUF488 family)
MSTLYTIGHSNHSIEHFVALLRRHEIDAVADVRSNPVSRMSPHFDKRSLKKILSPLGVQYVFLGKELGARRTEREAYDGRVARYEKIATLPAFRQGLVRVLEGMRKYRLALMCAEKDPLQCHRTILVCRHLRTEIKSGIAHITGGGELEAHEDAERRLLEECGIALDQHELFAVADAEPALERAYCKRGIAIAFRENKADEDQTVHDRLYEENR